MKKEGVLLINKPKGITSTRVVEKVKRRLRTKAGHTGTLDPIATGLLILLVGRATRFSWIFLELDKTYRVEVLLGVETDTYDVEGRIVAEREVNVTCEDVEKALPLFRGKLVQIPPPFSAKKVGGKRAYRLARKGEIPQLKPIEVNVYSLEMVRCNLPRVELLMRVSSGTYVRSLVHDLGKSLGTGAVVENLVREKVGTFSVEEAVDLETFLQSENPWVYVMDVEKALSFLPKVDLSFFHGRRILTGNPVLVERDLPEGYVRIHINETFIGVGEFRSGILKPRRLLLPEDTPVT